MLLIMLEQAFRKGRELEEIVFLGDRLRRPSAVRAGIAGLGLVYVQLIKDAILAGVIAFIDIAVLQAALEQPLHGLVVPWIGSADELVVLESEFIPLFFELGGNSGSEFFGRFAGGLSSALDFLPMLVGARRQHHRIEALHAPEALDHIGGNGGVRVADVR